MAYTPTSYYYFFYRDENERLKRLDCFTDFMAKYYDSEPIIEKVDTDVTGDGLQLVFNSPNSEHTFDIFNGYGKFCCEIDYEADINNSVEESYLCAKKISIEITKKRIIDVARVYSPKIKGRVFDYFGFEHFLLLFFLKMDNKINKLMKWEFEYFNLVKEMMKKEIKGDVVLFTSKEKKLFMKEYTVQQINDFKQKYCLS